MIPKLSMWMLLFLVSFCFFLSPCEGLLDETGCPTSFQKRCVCGMAYSMYDGFKDKKFTVNCTNSGFTNADMLKDIMERTQVLIFKGNTVPSLPNNIFGNDKEFDDLEVVDMTANHINFIQGKTFHKVYNVNTLILDHNNIDISNEKSRPRIFSNFETLERLHLTNAFAESINASDYLLSLEDIFYESDLIDLKVVHLEQNEIWSIGDNEKVFCQLESIQQILLGDNRLTDFDFRIDCLDDLRFIDLERNMIPRLSTEATRKLDSFMQTKNPPRFQVKLEQNPFSCDCRAEQFLHWISNTKIEVHDWQNYTCSDGYPADNIGTKFIEMVRTNDLRCPDEKPKNTNVNSGGKPITDSRPYSNAVRDNVEQARSYHDDEDQHEVNPEMHSSATVGILSFLLVFTTSILLAVAYFHRQRIKNVLWPYWDYMTRKIGYTGISHEEAPQEVNV